MGILPFGGETGEEETTEEDSGQVEMPKVVGRQLEEVKTELMGLGLMPEITYKETDEYEAGLILECNIGVQSGIFVIHFRNAAYYQPAFRYGSHRVHLGYGDQVGNPHFRIFRSQTDFTNMRPA